MQFLAFSAKLEIDLEHKPNKDHFELLASFTLGSDHSRHRAATLQADTGTVNPMPVSLTIGDDCGTASVHALIIH